jgi:hypothetical protein
MVGGNIVCTGHMLYTAIFLLIVIRLLSVLFYGFIWLDELRFSDLRQRKRQQSTLLQKSTSGALALVCRGKHATVPYCAEHLRQWIRLTRIGKETSFLMVQFQLVVCLIPNELCIGRKFNDSLSGTMA